MNNISKTLSYILRHKPEDYGLSMDAHGWVSVQELVDALVINIATLVGIVNQDTKGRYEFSSNTQFIRATQGHSIPVDLALEPFVSNITYLYHGTTDRFLSSILSVGLQKQSRNHVHLSIDADTAVDVGKRHGRPVVLQVDYQSLIDDGFKLYISKNNVVLIDEVPPKYLKVI